MDDRDLVFWAYLTVIFALPAVSLKIFTGMIFEIWYCIHKNEIESQGGINELFKRNQKRKDEETEEDKDLIKIPTFVKLCAHLAGFFSIVACLFFTVWSIFGIIYYTKLQDQVKLFNKFYTKFDDTVFRGMTFGLLIITIFSSYLLGIACLLLGYLCCICTPICCAAICENCCNRKTKFAKRLENPNETTCVGKIVIFYIESVCPLWMKVLFYRYITKVRNRIVIENFIERMSIKRDEERMSIKRDEEYEKFIV